MRIGLLAALTGRKALALAAGGLVLGVGVGATTLASWVDHESVWGGTGDTRTTPGGTGGGLSSSLFNMQQSANGIDYTDNAGTGEQLAFSATASTLSPNTTTYAYVYLRTVAKSVGGRVTLSPPDVTGDPGLKSVLTYGARSGGTAAQCTANGYAGTGTLLVPSGSPFTAGSGSTGFHLDAGTGSAPGTPVGVCFAVSMPDGVDSSVSGKQITPTWRFDAVSD